MRSNFLQKTVEKMTACSGSLCEVFSGHVAELQAGHVELGEGNTGGVQLVVVTAVLKPFTHMVLGPMFWG